MSIASTSMVVGACEAAAAAFDESEEVNLCQVDQDSLSNMVTCDEENDDHGYLIRAEDIKVECSEVGGPVSVDLDAENSAYLKGKNVLENIIDSNEPTDVILALSNGNLGAHRMILAAASPFLKFLMSAHDQKLHQVSTLILPDVSKETMKILLNLAYTGRMIYSIHEEVEVLEAIDLLKFAEYANLDLVPRQIDDPSIAKSAVNSKLTEKAGDSSNPNTGAQSVNSQTLGKTTPIIYAGGSDRIERVGCGTCNTYFPSLMKLLPHIETNHKEAWAKLKTSDEELQALTFCNVCGKQMKSIQVANKCLAKHNMVRCYVCLDAVKKDDYNEHYLSCHTNEDETMRKKKMTKCRWCSKLVSFDYQGSYLHRHCAMVHFHEGHAKKSSTTLKRKRVSAAKNFKSKQLAKREDLRELQVVLTRLDDEMLNKCFKRNKNQEQEQFEAQPIISNPAVDASHSQELKDRTYLSPPIPVCLTAMTGAEEHDRGQENSETESKPFETESAQWQPDEDEPMDVDEFEANIDIYPNQSEQNDYESIEFSMSEDETNSATCTTESESEFEEAEDPQVELQQSNNEVEAAATYVDNDNTRMTFADTSMESETNSNATSSILPSTNAIPAPEAPDNNNRDSFGKGRVVGKENDDSMSSVPERTTRSKSKSRDSGFEPFEQTELQPMDVHLSKEGIVQSKRCKRKGLSKLLQREVAENMKLKINDNDESSKTIKTTVLVPLKDDQEQMMSVVHSDGNESSSDNCQNSRHELEHDESEFESIPSIDRTDDLILRDRNYNENNDKVDSDDDILPMPELTPAF